MCVVVVVVVEIAAGRREEWVEFEDEKRGEELRWSKRLVPSFQTTRRAKERTHSESARGDNK
jgi:hypothetical protein